MQIRDIMNSECTFIDSKDSLQMAATLMDRQDIGALPVADNDKLVGMITDRDIVTRAVATNKDVRRTHVRELMSDRVLYCFDDEDIEKVAENMAEMQVRRLPVVDREKRLRGMVSLGDIAAKASGSTAGESLSHIAAAA